ncbi:hypothetical protein [Nonomuraea polychroma]|uniref:hypothetical protein n=1 Tax=Nonomuraea polychroma TaxID=46176 RepID=UPI000FDEB6F8|nr:hypothetical protein [Nonomuraea polychroma]
MGDRQTGGYRLTVETAGELVWESTPDRREALLAQIPTRTLGRPEDLARPSCTSACPRPRT